MFADIYGKVKSFFLDVANMVLMLYVGLSSTLQDTNFSEIVRYLGLAIMIVGVVLSVISCVNYSVKAVKALEAKTEVSSDTPREEDEE